MATSPSVVVVFLSALCPIRRIGCFKQPLLKGIRQKKKFMLALLTLIWISSVGTISAGEGSVGGKTLLLVSSVSVS